MDTSEVTRIKRCLKKLWNGQDFTLEWNEVWKFIDTIFQELTEKDDKIADLEQRLALYKKRYPGLEIMTPPDAINAWIEANK
ncbi:hypothetical protein LCGC14_0758050 [marine sediment metagenome]|uniref:Uncharacterized protein n=1 Tax=marine sediment metagenome TaxID=412755 RepID=A0A0F9T924_9ZZZZ